MIILRGVNIYPGQIDEVLSGIPDLGSEYQLHLERRDDGKDYMTLKVEKKPGANHVTGEEIRSRIRKAVQSTIMVSCEVEAFEYGGLPRYEGKSKRIFDNRGQ
jgi:phenylacetate-CoA ligase